MFRICPGAFKSLSVDSLLVEWGRLVVEDLASTAVRALEKYHLPGVMPVVQRASSQWYDITSTNFLLLATRARQWQQAWDANVPKIDGRGSDACGAGVSPEVTLYRPNTFTEGSLEEVGDGASGANYPVSMVSSQQRSMHCCKRLNMQTDLGMWYSRTP